MKSILVLLVVALIAVNGQTLCDKYQAALSLPTGLALVETVVNATIGAVVNPANKIDGFFNGKVGGGTDFTTNVGALNNLRTNLDAFFGEALNCTDKSTGTYTGANMTVAHAGLPINFFAFFTFNNLLLNVMTGAGVVATDAKAIAMLLDSLRPSICNQADCTSICNKLVTPGVGTANATVATVVNATVFAALGDATLAPYFTGKTGSRPDYTLPANADKLKTLFDHLVSFFGGALGCSDGTIATYAGQSLKDAHTGMGVTDAAFNTFNSALMGILKPFISAAEFDTVYGVLNSTRADIVATSTTATTATTATTTGTSTTATGTSTSTSSKSGTSTTSSGSTSTTSASTTPAPSSTGFGLVLAPVFAMFTIFLF